MRRTFVFAGLALLSFAGLGFACTLDLDEALITKKGDGGGVVMIGDASLPDGTVVSESGVPIIPDAGACTKDDDCVSANACLKPRCDLSRRACSYDVCHTASCTAGSCDQGSKTCSQPQTYKEKAGEIALAQASTGGIIAAYPWVFQLTTTGVLVYDVSNPTKTTLTQVPLVGLGFVPSQFARSGNRIWMIAPLNGTPARLPIAYIDIPADPFTTKIEAHSVLANYSRPATEGVGLLPSENKGPLLVGPTPAFATAQLDTLLAEPATKTATPLVAKENTSPIGVSGSRLLMQLITPLLGTANPQFGLISGAGTTNPTTGDLVTIADMGDVSTSRGSASSLDGTLFFVTANHQPGAGEPGVNVTKAVKAYFLLKDGKASLDATVKGVDLEVYSLATAPGANADVVRAPAMVDNDTAVVAVAATDNATAATAINFVKRDLTVNKEKRLVLPTPVNTIVSSSASNGVVYIAANIPSGTDGVPPSGKLYIIDPSCTP